MGKSTKKRLVQLRELFDGLLEKIRTDGPTIEVERNGAKVLYPHPLLKQLPALSRELSRLESELDFEEVAGGLSAIDPAVLLGRAPLTISEKRSRNKATNPH